MPIDAARYDWNVQARVGRLARDIERTADEQREEADDGDHADEAELFGQHREHEVRVRLREVEELLHARPEADPEPLAAPDRDQRLHELEAAVERVLPGVAEGREAAHAVGRGDGEQRHAGHGDQHRDEQVVEPHAGEEQDREARGHQHGRGSEIGLREQQHGRRAQHGHRLHESLEAGAQLVGPAHRVARDVGEQHHAREFGHLEVHDAEPDPAPAAVDLVAEAGHQHQHQQHERAAEQVDGVLFPHAGRDRDRQQRGHETEADEDQLPLEVEERVAGLALGDADRRRGHHDQAHEEQRRDGPDQPGIEGEAPRLAGGARVGHRRRGHAARLLTAAANSSPRCA